MKKIAFIGAGSIAEALISGIIGANLLDGKNIAITNRQNEEKLKELQHKYGTSYTYELSELIADADVVILAMKPKDAAASMRQIREYLRSDMLIVSVLAGVSMESLEMLAEKPLAIVRAMPNTSATVRKSATAFAANERVSKAQIDMCKQIFETIGLAAFVEEEKLDAVTGLSGSGPAYIYYLIEAMEKSAEEIGLDCQMAQDLIVQTLIGAAEMVANSAKSPKQLRHEVTSPGGTTEAGIKVLESHHVQDAFISCIKEATAQSKRLGDKMSLEMETVQNGNN